MTHPSAISLDAITSHFDGDGFAFPYRVFPADEALGYREQIEALLRSNPQASEYARGLAHLVCSSG